MKKSTENVLNELIVRYRELEPIKENISRAFQLILQAFCSGKKLLIAGNGGSAADCEHIVGELMKSFKKKRPIQKDVTDKLQSFGEDGLRISEKLEGSLPAIALTNAISLSTAIANDIEQNIVFAQQLYGIAQKGDVFLAISTSGNSKNCVYAAITAKALGLKVISMTGCSDSKLSNLSDLCIRVPEFETFKVQELHLPVYHCLCAMLEEEFFD